MQLSSRAPAQTLSKSLRCEECGYASSKGGWAEWGGKGDEHPTGAAAAPGLHHPLQGAAMREWSSAHVCLSAASLPSCDHLAGRVAFAMGQQMELFISQEPWRMVKTIKPGVLIAEGQ